MSENDFTADAIGRVAYVGGNGEHDDWAPDGVHWQVSLPDESLPAGPVVVFEGNLDTSAQYPLGRNLQFEVVPETPLWLAIPSPIDAGTAFSWVDVDADGDLQVAVIDTGDPAPNDLPVQIAARRAAPYFLAAPDIRLLMITGKGVVQNLRAWARPLNLSDSLGAAIPVDVTGLPEEVAGDPDAPRLPGYQWRADFAQSYLQPGDWAGRVKRSAPQRALPYESPADPAGTDDELRRVGALAEVYVQKWTERAYGLLADRDAMASAEASLTAEVTPDVGAAQVGEATVGYPVLAALETACVDPGVARWLGRSGTFPAVSSIDAPRMFIAMVPVYRWRRGRLQAMPPRVPRILGAHYDAWGGGSCARAVEKISDFYGGSPLPIDRWEVSLLVIALPAAPVAPSVPEIPEVTDHSLTDLNQPVAQSRWRAEPGPPWAWDCVLRLRGCVPNGRASVVQVEPAWRSLHDLDDDTGLRRTVLPGWPPDTAWDKAAVVLASGFTVADGDDDTASVQVGARLGDWIGRWSPQVETDVIVPPRPAPAGPSIDGVLIRGSVPNGTAAASPGDLQLTVTLPKDRSLGGRAVTAVRLSGDVTATLPVVDATSVSIKAGDGPDGLPQSPLQMWRWTVARAAPKTVPGQQLSPAVAAAAVDTAGVASSAVRCTIQVSDPRPIAPPNVAPQLLVTSRRTTAERVSIAVQVTPPPGGAGEVSYRFLIASERTLRPLAAMPINDLMPRSERAKLLVQVGGERRHYSWAQDQPVPVVGGVARATLELPSGTSDVVLIKAVPVVGPPGQAAEGVSTPFGVIAAAPVVVPTSDVPSAPEVTTEVVGGEVRVRVSVAGVDKGVLARQPGALQARIVEAIAGVEPNYWPQVTLADLSGPDADDRYVGTASLAGVPAWTRCAVAAAVRYPAEATLAAGAQWLEADVTAAGPQGKWIESPWGPVSAPSYVTVAGRDLVLVDASDDQQIAVQVSAAAEADVVGGWTLEVLSGAPGAPLVRTDTRLLTAASDGVLQTPLDPALQFAARLVDPFGVPRDVVRLG